MSEDQEAVGSDCLCVLGSKRHQPDCEYYTPTVCEVATTDKIGAKLHKVLNNTLSRKLSTTEYSEVIKLVQALLAERDIEIARLREELEDMRLEAKNE